MMTFGGVNVSRATTRRCGHGEPTGSFHCHLTLHGQDGEQAVDIRMPRPQLRQLLAACLQAVHIRGQASVTTSCECSHTGGAANCSAWRVGEHDGGISIWAFDGRRAAFVVLLLPQLERFFEEGCAVYGAQSSDIFMPGVL